MSSQGIAVSCRIAKQKGNNKFSVILEDLDNPPVGLSTGHGRTYGLDTEQLVGLLFSQDYNFEILEMREFEMLSAPDKDGDRSYLVYWEDLVKRTSMIKDLRRQEASARASSQKYSKSAERLQKQIIAMGG